MCICSGYITIWRAISADVCAWLASCWGVEYNVEQPIWILPWLCPNNESSLHVVSDLCGVRCIARAINLMMSLKITNHSNLWSQPVHPTERVLNFYDPRKWMPVLSKISVLRIMGFWPRSQITILVHGLTSINESTAYPSPCADGVECYTGQLLCMLGISNFQPV